MEVESHGVETAKRIHGRLGSFVYWILGSGVFPHVRKLINSWTTQAKKTRGSMPSKFEVRDVLRLLEEAGLENRLPIYDDGRMFVE